MRAFASDDAQLYWIAAETYWNGYLGSDTVLRSVSKLDGTPQTLAPVEKRAGDKPAAKRRAELLVKRLKRIREDVGDL
ncbi:MAG TPA: hypothetical protein VHB97_11390 [Polyangia bacterium]|nr:hypothetical protein [Polyangia bacterium]